MPTKNIALLKRLRTRFLRMRHAKHFDMETVGSPTGCGAAMCIAGHALDLAGYKHKTNKYLLDEFDWFTPKGRRVYSPLDVAQRLLGLTYHEARTSCFKRHALNGLFHRYDLKTPKQAAAVIGNLIEG